MKHINELDYLRHIARTEQLTKDKRQKNKPKKAAFLDNDQTFDDESEEFIEINAITEETERRTGSDRRKNTQERGRYVESRQKKNRRHKEELRIII